MKVSRLIRALQKAQKEHGDLPVRMHGPDNADVDVGEVQAYDARGNNPQGRERTVEIYLHAGLDLDHIGN